MKAHTHRCACIAHLVLTLSFMLACALCSCTAKKEPAAVRHNAPAPLFFFGTHDFRNADWGMSMQDVQKSETARALDFQPYLFPGAQPGFRSYEDELHYALRIAGADMTLRYVFINDKLKLGQSLLSVVGEDSFAPLMELAGTCRNELIRRYGPPDKSDSGNMELTAIEKALIFSSLRIKPVRLSVNGDTQATQECILQNMAKSLQGESLELLSTDNAFGDTYTWQLHSENGTTEVELSAVLLPVVKYGYIVLDVRYMGRERIRR